MWAKGCASMGIQSLLCDIWAVLESIIVCLSANARETRYAQYRVIVKAVTLIFISGLVSTISSAKQGKSGSIYNLLKNN